MNYYVFSGGKYPGYPVLAEGKQGKIKWPPFEIMSDFTFASRAQIDNNKL